MVLSFIFFTVKIFNTYGYLLLSRFLCILRHALQINHLLPFLSLITVLQSRVGKFTGQQFRTHSSSSSFASGAPGYLDSQESLANHISIILLASKVT